MNRTTEKSRRKSISAMKDDKRLKRKVRNSYIVSTVSITLVLFLLGSVGYLMVAAMKVADTLQESIAVTVELENGLSDEQKDADQPAAHGRRPRGDDRLRRQGGEDRGRRVPQDVRQRIRGDPGRKPAARLVRADPHGRLGRQGAARRLHRRHLRRSRGSNG